MLRVWTMKVERDGYICHQWMLPLALRTKSLSRVQLFATPWTIICQATLSMGILQARILEWVAMPASRGSSQPRNQTPISLTAGGSFTVWATREMLKECKPTLKNNLEDHAWLFVFKSFVQLVQSLLSSNNSLLHSISSPSFYEFPLLPCFYRNSAFTCSVALIILFL